MIERGHQTPDNREPQAQPGSVLRVALWKRSSVKFLEDHFKLVFVDPRTGIDDFDRDVVSTPTRPDQNTTTVRVANGIRNQVLKRAPQHQAVRVDAIVGNRDSQTKTFFFRNGAQVGQETGENRRNGHRREAGRGDTGVKFRNIQ